MLIRVLHEPFTVSLVVQPMVRKSTRTQLLDLFFCIDVFSFFVSQEDISLVKYGLILAFGVFGIENNLNY